MSKSAVITARVDPETLALIDKLVAAQGRSRAWFVAKAVQRAAEAEADFLAFVQEGIDAADRGELIPHEEVLAEIDAMIAEPSARCDDRSEEHTSELQSLMRTTYAGFCLKKKNICTKMK